MKIVFMTLSLLSLLPRAYAEMYFPNQTIHRVRTSKNHCDLSFDKQEQQRQAIRDLLDQAELACGPGLVPIQVSETSMGENHSCIHYRLGVWAKANFKCGVLDYASCYPTS